MRAALLIVLGACGNAATTSDARHADALADAHRDASGAGYSTTFDLTESPILESGV